MHQHHLVAEKTDDSKHALCSISCTLKNVILSLRPVVMQKTFLPDLVPMLLRHITLNIYHEMGRRGRPI